jgi:hypothetical protein
VSENEDKRYMKCLREAVGVCEAPGEGCKGEKEAEEVCEGGVGAVVCFGCLFLKIKSARPSWCPIHQG